MPVNDKKQRLIKIIELMEKEYPDAKCSLNADNPFQLLVATRLSAQCTDARVNIITPALFTALPTPKDFANAKCLLGDKPDGTTTLHLSPYGYSVLKI